MDEALAWPRRAVVACRAPVEVRSFFRSDPTGLLARRPLKEGRNIWLHVPHIIVGVRVRLLRRLHPVYGELLFGQSRTRRSDAKAECSSM
jgi:hypothetical protein